MNFDRNYVRLNEWPDENTPYEIAAGTGQPRVLLGSDLSDGIPVSAPARLRIRPLPAARPAK